MKRRQFLKCLAAGAAIASVPSSLWAFDRQHRITIGRFSPHPNQAQPRSGSLRRLLQEVDRRTSIEVNTDITTVHPTRDELFESPMLAWSGDRRFDPMDDDALSALRTYLLAGGFLFVDAADGLSDGPFLEAVRRDLGRAFPDRDIQSIPQDHTVHESFYLIERPKGRVDRSEQMEGIADADRLAVIISSNDVLGALARDTLGNWEHDVRPGGDRQREMAFRLGINLVMYALTVNYKADQVHIPFILERRQWQVGD